VSSIGAPVPERLDASDLKVAIIAAKWHDKVMDGLIAGAKRALLDANLAVAKTEITPGPKLQEVIYPKPNVKLVRVPGTFELPVAAARFAKAGYDAIVTLGVVIRGGTPHFEYVCEAATMGLTQVSVDTGVPIGFGVLTCDDEQQALARSGLPGSNEDKGYEACMAALETALVLKEATKADRLAERGW